MTAWRLPEGGALIDRDSPLRWRWTGRGLGGFAGDTIASALLANDEVLAARSFKYHRPRGLIGAGLDEPNVLVQLGRGARTVPNLKATAVAIEDGLEAAPVNCWPSPGFDLLGINALIRPFIPAAFYYKTFKWPDWHLFEPLIRRAAGLGKAPAIADPDRYEHAFVNCDALVIGGGRSGLAEALALAQRGLDVVIAEHEPFWGGHRRGASAQNDAELAQLVASLSAFGNVRMWPHTLVFGAYDHNAFGLRQMILDPQDDAPRERLIHLRCKQCVLASGAIERPLLFANNDLPGIMLASAGLAFLHRQAVVPGRRIGFAVNNDAGWEAARAYLHRGVRPAFVVDSRPNPQGPAVETLCLAGVPVLGAARIEGAAGRRRLRGVRVSGQFGSRNLACDALLVAGGFNPAVSLHSQASGRLAWREDLASFVPREHLAGWRVLGRAAGKGLPPVPPIAIPDPNAGPSGSVWVDYQNDVTVRDVALAARESYTSVEHLKRYTTMGMATDQGKTSTVNGLAVVGHLTGRAPAEVGTTRFRPPYDPVTVGAFAGDARGALLDMVQRLPAHERHLSLGAQMMEYGSHLRPAAYPAPGEMLDAAITREVQAVREAVGLFDASPLGKIEVHGPDAAQFMDLVCVAAMASLAPGRCRYTLFAAETGILIDDGVCVRRGDGSFILGTSSGGRQRMLAQLEEYLQCEWPQLKVAMIDVTDQWAVLTLAGPRARSVLESSGIAVDLSPDSLPHLGYAEGSFEGRPIRLSRVSYTGELSFEVSCPADLADDMAGQILTVGAGHDIIPFGIEALDVMRIEKGFLHVGNETDGTTMPQDVRFGAALARKASDFIGRRGALMPVGRDPGRKQLVGLASLDGSHLPVGAHLRAASGMGSDGWVTSSVISPTLGCPHALAMIADGGARIGEVIALWDLGPDNRGRTYRARIVDPCAFDPDGGRMRDAA
ncbi:FAD-binding protein [Sphingopyxis sp. YF1]|uniref:2Fe-2S iron-sulfur cluster-binding protein n=1 Tax=unclassified Sphingopyxis TaxID=2614943 RepID=UPI001F618468|nr:MULTISPECIES: 2Fe-2S iron-sulfur cluster-binding protein [unclassified Sphingopyxis]UNU44641.1 FAD-binding protein [Sphingopyxis sp. YF1]USI76619.1 (2Fe-2S)-binding protein [Sphingopyxis sp. USTB-05]